MSRPRRDVEATPAEFRVHSDSASAFQPIGDIISAQISRASRPSITNVSTQSIGLESTHLNFPHTGSCIKSCAHRGTALCLPPAPAPLTKARSPSPIHAHNVIPSPRPAPRRPSGNTPHPLHTSPRASLQTRTVYPLRLRRPPREAGRLAQHLRARCADTRDHAVRGAEPEGGAPD